MKKAVEAFLGRGIVTLNCGMSNGGECRVTKWTLAGPQEVGKFPLPFHEDPELGRVYDLDGLRTFWDIQRPELGGKSLREVIAGSAAMGMSYWGADLVAFDLEGNPIDGINYPTAMGCREVEEYIKGLPTLWWYERLLGCAQAAYQPLGQLQYLRLKWEDWMWRHVREVVPVTDYLYSMLVGQRGHDLTMAQSMGLRGEARLNTEQRFGAPLTPGALAPWGQFDTNTVHVVGDVSFVPFTHDSPLARAVGFSVAPVVVWTGSWVGVAASIAGTSLVPCQATLDAGLSFEGLRPAAVQKNTGMFGPVYKVLLQRAGMSYEEAAEFILGSTSVPDVTIDLAKIDALPADEAAEYVLDNLEADGEHVSASEALFVVLHAAVDAVWADLQKLVQITSQSLTKVAVVGGWAENKAFCTLLQLKGVRVVKPPHAAQATDVGLVAEILRRLLLAAGSPMDLDQILAELPME